MHTVEHRLRFLLESTTLRVLKIEEKVDSSAIVDFNTKFCDCKRASGFCSEISDTTQVMIFGVPLSPDSTTHKVIFCELAVGNSIFVSDTYVKDLDVPSCADSLITVQGAKVSGYLSDSPYDVDKFSYVVKDRSKVLPLYEVTFEYDAKFEKKSRDRVTCNKCTVQDAVMFCPSERASFCASCDETVHADPFLQRHERKYFADIGQKKFFCCSSHPEKTVEYFCGECRETLCTECKITGSHSTGDKSKHVITPFIEACRDAVQYVTEGRGRIDETLKKTVAEHACYVNELVSFKSGVVTVRRQLEKEFNMLMQQLDMIENRQRQAINAQLVEWMYHTEELKRMMKYPEMLDPADLLVSLKNIDEQGDKIKVPEVGKFGFQKPEIHGRITLKVPKGDRTDDICMQNLQAIDLRIKTMNISGPLDVALD